MTNELALLEAQQAIHDLIARQAPLEDTLAAIAESMDMVLPGALVSIMRFDAKTETLSLVPSRHFSRHFTALMQNIRIGPEMGTCGTTAHYRRPVITEDIRTDPRWDGFKDAALGEGLRACWSVPVVSSQDELLGTFAIYSREPTAPCEASMARLEQAAALVALAIVRDRDCYRHRTLAESHRSLFVNHPDGIYELDLEGRFQRCNAAVERISGYPEQALLGRHFNEFVAPDYRELTQAAFDDAKAGASRHYETCGHHSDGHRYHLDITNFPMTVDGEIVGVYGICRDITQRKRQEDELRLFQRGIEASPNGITVASATQHDTPVIYVNDAFCRMTGYTRDETLGQNLRFLQGPETSQNAVSQLRHATETCTPAQVVLLNYRKDGTRLWTNMSINPIFDEAGRCSHFVGTQQDISLEYEQAAEIAYQANHDLLTGLPNRVALDSRLAQDLEWSQQHQHRLAVLYLDLDGFKAINDGLGYHIGNQLLIAVAERLRPLLGPLDTLAHLSGNEFVFVMPEIKAREEAETAAERILAVFKPSFEIEGRLVHISTSVGIASNDETVYQAHELLRHADLAVDAAKQQGRNTWQWYRGKGTQVVSDHVLLRHDLHAALSDHQFELYYQPIVEAVSGRIRSVEALIRWHHPIHGIISPGVFIPIAEQTGQIVPLGRWVLREACQSLADRYARGERACQVSVNISALQFRRDGFLDEVQGILDATGLPPELLELEMTESILMDEAEQAIERIGTLRRMGISVAIDDFGTGFSSLSYLRDLPINKVKLDQAFIQNILVSPPTAAIIQGIITMARHLGLTVVAEGVEDREQQADLVRRKCDLLQGFLFSRPLPLEEMLALPERLACNE
ncbi:MAG: EAL domain-containing protein [Halomonas sp.]